MDHDKTARRALLVAKALKHHASVIHNPASIMGNPPPPVARYGMVSPHLTQIAPVARADGGDVNKALNVVGQQQADSVAVAKQVASMPPARQLSPMGLYSQGAETAAALPQAKGSPQQMKAMLKGVKQEELAGYDDAFGNKKSVTKDEIAQHFQQNMPQVEERVLHSDDNETKFSEYTLPGGENYREVLLKMPPKNEASAFGKSMEEKYGSEWLDKMSAQESAMYDNAVSKLSDKEQGSYFKSSHWDDPNVLAHLRMADRTGPNGEKILHLEELQSDWGQKGKKEGFVTQYKPEDIKPMDPANITSERRRNEFWNFETPTGSIDVPRNDRWPTMEAARQHILDNMKPTGIPAAPYVTSTHGWTDLALKRALKEAAEGRYNKLVWTPGAEQAKRYDLSKQISNLEYVPSDNHLKAYDTSGRQVMNQMGVPPEKISDYVGKDVAAKLLNDENAVKFNGETGFHRLSGLDLQTGGEGMEGYYDKIVPKRLQELVKKHDPEARIGQSEIPGSGKKTYAPIPDHFFQYTEDVPALRGATDLERSNWWDSQTKQERKRIKDEWIAKRQYEPNVAAHSLTITPKMRESILRGQPAFKRGGAIPLHPAQGGIVQGEAPIHALHLTSKFGNSLPSAVNQAKAATRRRP